jgi:hypothetical protein
MTTHDTTATGVVIRYRVHEGHAEENAALVRAVYAELAEREPAGFRYVTSLLEDGRTFVHIALMDDGVDAPLPQLEAFRRFRAGLDERCEAPLQRTPLPTRIGAYGL